MFITSATIDFGGIYSKSYIKQKSVKTIFHFRGTDDKRFHTHFMAHRLHSLYCIFRVLLNDIYNFTSMNSFANFTSLCILFIQISHERWVATCLMTTPTFNSHDQAFYFFDTIISVVFWYNFCRLHNAFATCEVIMQHNSYLPPKQPTQRMFAGHVVL